MMTIEAMKQALEAFEHMCHHTRAKVGYKGEMVGDAMESLRQAIAEAEQDKPLCTAEMFDKWFLAKSGLDPKTLLYTRPQPRTWVGLTDEEINEFETWLDNEEERIGWNPPPDIVKYLEAKLKEKNNG